MVCLPQTAQGSLISIAGPRAPNLPTHSYIMQNHPQQQQCRLPDKQHGNKMLNVANANVWQLVIAARKTPKKGVAILYTGKNVLWNIVLIYNYFNFGKSYF